MNPSNWMRLMLWLTAETTMLLGGAALLQLWLTSPRARRILWQAALTATGLITVVEISGVRDMIPAAGTGQDRYTVSAAVRPSTANEASVADRQSPTVVSEVEPIIKWPAWIWLAGSTLLLLRFFIARIWLGVRQWTAARADEDSVLLVKRLKTSLGLKRVRAEIWGGLRSPVAFGIVRPTIALPPDFAIRFSGAEKEAVLAHEIAHLAAADPFWLTVSDAVIILAWWHPLVWWARNQLQSANEAAADEASVLIPGGAQVLAECLVRLGHEMTAHHPARVMGIGGNRPRSQLATRIQCLLREPAAWRRSSIWLRWIPQLSALIVAGLSAILPIQTGLSGSILAVLGTEATVRAADVAPTSQAPGPIVTNRTPPADGTTSTSEKDETAIADKIHNARILYRKSDFRDADDILKEVSSDPSNKTAAYEDLTKDLYAPNPLANAPGPSPKLQSTFPIAMRQKATGLPHIEPGHKRPTIWLKIQVLVIPDHSADDIGLDWIFGVSPADNPALEITHDWTSLGTSSVTHSENLVIDRLRIAGQSTILKPAQFAALRQRIRGKDESFTSTPSIITASGCEACVSVQEAQSYVTGVELTHASSNNGASVNYLTDNIYVGLATDILPTLQADGKWRLRVRASDSAFLDYDKDAPGPDSPSKLNALTPRPHFRAVETEAEDDVPLNQTMALRGPLWSETVKTRGHFFFSGKTTTARKRLYVFVTPVEPPPAKEGK